MSKKRIAQLVLVVGALAVFYVLSRAWPKDQTLRFDLGAASARVVELRVRYGRPGESEPPHGADYHFDAGKAPRVVTNEARLPDGDYVVEVEVATTRAHGSATKQVHLEGGSVTTIDLSRDVPE